MPSKEFFTRKKEHFRTIRQGLSDINRRARLRPADMKRALLATAGLMAVVSIPAVDTPAPAAQASFKGAHEPFIHSSSHALLPTTQVAPEPAIIITRPSQSDIPPQVPAPELVVTATSVPESLAAVHALSNEPQERAEFPIMTDEDVAAIHEYIHGTLFPALVDAGLTIVEPINEEAGQVNQPNTFIVAKEDEYGEYGAQFAISKSNPETYHVSAVVFGKLVYLRDGAVYEKASWDGRLGHQDPGGVGEARNFSPNDPDPETLSTTVRFVQAVNKDKTQRMAEDDRLREQKEAENAG